MAMASAQGIEEDADPALTLLELLGRVETRAVEVGRPRPCTSDWGDLTWAESV